MLFNNRFVQLCVPKMLNVMEVKFSITVKSLSGRLGCQTKTLGAFPIIFFITERPDDIAAYGVSKSDLVGIVQYVPTGRIIKFDLFYFFH